MSWCYFITDKGERVVTVQFQNQVASRFINRTVELVASSAHNVTDRFVLYTDGYSGLQYNLDPNLIKAIKSLQQRNAAAIFFVDRKRAPGYLSVYVTKVVSTLPCGVYPLDVPNSIFARLFRHSGGNASHCNCGNSNNSSNCSACNDNEMYITFHGWDDNPWITFLHLPGFMAWCVTLWILHASIVGWGCYKLWRWFNHEQGVGLSITTCCLVFNVLGAFFRIFSVSSFIYGSPFTRKVFDTIYYPFTFSGSIVLIFFWLDMTSNSLYQGKFLDKMKIPAFVSVTIMFLIEILLIVCNFYESLNFKIIIIAIYYIVGFTIACIYFVAGFRILRFSKETKTNRLIRVTIIVISSGVGLVSYTILMMFLAFPGYSDYPLVFAMLFYSVFVIQCCVNGLEISVFDVPKLRKTRASVSTSDILRSSSRTSSVMEVKPTTEK